MHRLVLGSVLPLAVAIAVMATPTYAEKPSNLTIQIQDQCDPTTFNTLLGPGMCGGNGNVSFATFLTQVQNTHRAPQWRFVPDELHVKLGQIFMATNMGGEAHTFTEVTPTSGFGGGIVPFLNNASGLTTLAPACSNGTVQGVATNPGPLTLLTFVGDPKSFLPPGASFSDTPGMDDVGHPNLYQCCIHPWMHEVITVDP
jgi:hypothetical protein